MSQHPSRRTLVAGSAALGALTLPISYDEKSDVQSS